jgi:Sap, sulfolipid-1-addressing protein
MLPAIVQSLPIAVGVLLASVPYLAITLILVTRGDATALVSFVSGWVGGFLVVGGIVILMIDTISMESGITPDWVNGVMIPLGILLLFLGWRQWQGRPRNGAVPAPPRWMGMIDSLTPLRAAGLGFMSVAFNPKNIALVLSGAVTIATATLVPFAQLGALLVFTVVASLGVALPLLVSLLLGERATAPLLRFKAWMMHNNASIMAVALSLLGVMVFANGVTKL